MGQRIKVTASNTNVDSDQTHFPLLLTLGTSVGTGSNDVSFVLYELTSDANRTKIAVTKTDGTTELYVEIEKWDDANEAAVLWVSKSDWVLDADANTEVYLYYDSAHADNTDRVGDIGGRTEVWDSSFEAVTHMVDLTTSTVDDSTSNNYVYTKLGANTPAETASGKIAEAQDFDGTDDVITITDAAGLNIRNNLTVTSWIKRDAQGDYDWVVSRLQEAGDERVYQILVRDTNTVTVQG